ncbi:zinc metalloproteinase-disintegrin-like batroxstatin-3 [Biomphalaria glabrata]|uniref:Zinc metalloproteinase-disintegrin-like batroxstatin-3 n=1 Tax=Biomphalaria glabrata TaxID=6526 RepID=A0A9W2Z358_BIOGL|nr:zinc metalloproteinase-disintegrin-like batroxstatin-3 [Biomphalaria glabrata]
MMTSFYSFMFVLTYWLVTLSAQAQSYVAEGYFLVDDKVVQSYLAAIPETLTKDVRRAKAIEELNKDIDYVINEINQLFSSVLTNGLTLEIRVRKLDVLPGNIFPANATLSTVPSGISSDVALKLFDNWVLAQNLYNLTKFDFAFLLTGFDLYGSAGSFTAGYAHVGKMCDPKLATGIGEFSRNYFTALSTAHEIGHILGSEHGGPASTNIMSSQLDPTDANRWSFSGCSVTDFKEYMATLNPNCLLTTDPASTKPTLTYGSYTGQILDPEAICQRTLNNSKSYMCKTWGFYNDNPPSGDKVCSEIYCSIPGTQYCSSAFSSEGMVCDAAMRCKSGKCLPDSSAPTNIDSKCVYGDQKILEIQSQGFYNTCQVFLSKNSPSVCYQSSINQRCCSSCKQYYTGRTGCEYGDRSVDCTKYSKDSICPNYKDTLCCGYCAGYVGKRSNLPGDIDLVANAPELSLPPNVTDTFYAMSYHGQVRGQE